MAGQRIQQIENVDIQMVDSMNRTYILRLNAFLRMERYAELARQEDYQSAIGHFAYFGGGTLLVALLLTRQALTAMVVRPLEVAVDHLQHLAKADLAQTIHVTSRNEVGQLLAAMRDMQQSLGGTREIAAGNADLSSRTK